MSDAITPFNPQNARDTAASIHGIADAFETLERAYTGPEMAEMLRSIATRMVREADFEKARKDITKLDSETARREIERLGEEEPK